MTQEIQMLTQKNQDLQAESVIATDNLERAIHDLSREKEEFAAKIGTKDKALTDLKRDLKEVSDHCNL